MVSFSTAPISSRTLQLIVAVVMLGLSSMIIKEKNKLSGQAEQLSNYNLFMNGTALDLDSNWKKSAAALAASAFSISSSSVNYMFPTIMSKLKNGYLSGDLATGGSKYLELSMSEFVNTKPFQINAEHSKYINLLGGSETIAHSFWFTNLILQVGDYSNSQCTDVDSLLTNYNLTGSSISPIASFFNVFSNSTEGQWADDIFQQLQKANITQFSDINLNDLNSTETEAQLLLSLSYNCQLKKASMGMTVVLWALYAVTTGLFATDAIGFYSQFKNLQAKMNAQQKDQEANIVANENEPVRLIFHHPWCLFKVDYHPGTNHMQKELSPSDEQVSENI